MSSDVHDHAWEEFKSANADDEVWAQLAADEREDGFIAFLEEAGRLLPEMPRCADTMHQINTFDVCSECGAVWGRS
jgi:hypothetical protein